MDTPLKKDLENSIIDSDGRLITVSQKVRLDVLSILETMISLPCTVSPSLFIQVLIY